MKSPQMPEKADFDSIEEYEAAYDYYIYSIDTYYDYMRDEVYERDAV